MIGICRRRTKDAGPEASARSLSACGRSTKRSAGRDLSEFAEAYLFVDGVAERLHAGLPREAVLCAWGLTDDGRKVLLHLAPGTKEDTASCTAFFEDLKRRASPIRCWWSPMARRAVETCFPRALRQRCLVHRLRNLHSKAPDSLAGDRDSGARDELMSRMTTEEHGEMYELLTKMREIQEAAAARSAAPPASHLTSPR